MFTGVQRPVLKFSEICTFSVLYKAYLAARRGKRSRAATANYEVHLLANIVNLVYILQTKIYRPGLFRVFYVYEPKKRLVQAICIKRKPPDEPVAFSYLRRLSAL